jgi:hypothetical protein
MRFSKVVSGVGFDATDITLIEISLIYQAPLGNSGGILEYVLHCTKLRFK